MNILRKVLSAIVMVLSALGLLLCMAGLIGAVALNEPITNIATGALGAMENTLGIASQASELSVQSLGDAQAGVDRVNRAAANATSEDKAQVADSIKQAVDDRLAPAVTRVRSTLSVFASAVVQFNRTLESVNSIPGVRVPTLTDELQAVGQRIDQVEAAISDVKASVADAASLDGSRITAATAKASSELQALQSAITQVQSRIQTTSAAIVNAQAGLPGAIDAISLIGSLLFVLYGAGQVFLFLAALHWFKRQA